MSQSAYKIQATRLANYLKGELGISVTRATALELTAAVYGARDWNTLAAGQHAVSDRTRSSRNQRKLSGYSPDIREAVQRLTELGANEGDVFQAVYNGVPGIYVLESEDIRWTSEVANQVAQLARALRPHSELVWRDTETGEVSAGQTVVVQMPPCAQLSQELNRLVEAGVQVWLLMPRDHSGDSEPSAMTRLRNIGARAELVVQALTVTTGRTDGSSIRLVQTHQSETEEYNGNTFRSAVLRHLKAGRLTVPAAAQALRKIFKIEWS